MPGRLEISWMAYVCVCVWVGLGFAGEVLRWKGWMDEALRTRDATPVPQA